MVSHVTGNLDVSWVRIVLLTDVYINDELV